MADRDIGSLTEAVVLLDEWIEAYGELQRENARLVQRCRTAETLLEHARAVIANDLNPPKVREREAIESECPF